MAKMSLKTKRDIIDFVNGCAFWGTGGGGLPKNGVESLMSELNKGNEITWVDVNDIHDDAVTVCPFLMGSIAPHTPEVLKEMEKFGLNNSVYKEKERLAAAVNELGRYMDKKINVLVPIELGGANTPGCVAAAVSNGMVVVDGDYTGRAIPEIQQTTPYLGGKALWPITSVDEWGNVVIIKDSVNYLTAERIGKLISAGAYGLSGDAGFMMSGKEMKEVLISGTLTECYNTGKMIRETIEAGEDPISKLVNTLSGWILIKGIVSKKEWEDRIGYYWGAHFIEGIGEFSGNQLKIWFKNENHVAWKNGSVIATSPDIISVVNLKTGDPIVNPDLKEGDEVAVIGLKARPEFRNSKGISILGPKYFGFNFDYVPIEKLMK